MGGGGGTFNAASNDDGWDQSNGASNGNGVSNGGGGEDDWD